MSTTVGMWLEPLDVLFFRDGRPFTAAARGISGMPVPQTLAGAVRTALLESCGCDFGRLREAPGFVEGVRQTCRPEHHWITDVACRGPWLARRNDAQPEDPEVLVPCPAILRAEKRQPGEQLHRLLPLPADQLPGWQPPESEPGLRPLWLRQRTATEAVEGYLTPAGLRAFLRGDGVGRANVLKADDLFGFDDRTGVGIDPDRLTSEESLIYGSSFLALRQDVGLYAEVVLPDGAPAGALEALEVLALGGEGRRVRAMVLPKPFAWPEERAAGRGLLLLTTPGLFQAGWRPTALPHPAAAAVPGSVAVSGWDLARGGPKPTRFAVPAGSVYFLDELPEGLPDALADDPEDRRQGWGCYLKGTWTDA